MKWLRLFKTITLALYPTNTPKPLKPSTQCMLVDDDLDDQEIFGMALQEIDRSITCDFAGDGMEALERLRVDHAYKPDFIFLDVNMPRMNGLDCLKAIRALKHLDTVEVIMYSTSSEARLIAACIDSGANDYIEKPAGLSTLTKRLTQVINK